MSQGTVDVLAGETVARAIRNVLRAAGRLPATRDVVVEKVSMEVDNGIELGAWAPGYPAEFKRARNESCVWVITLREFTTTRGG